MTENNGWNNGSLDDRLYMLAMEEKVTPARKTHRKRTRSKAVRVFAAALAISTAVGASFGAGFGFGGALGTGTAIADSITADGTGIVLPQEQEDAANFIPVAALSQTGTASVSDIFKAVQDSVVSINTTVQVTNIFNQVRSQSSAGSGIIFREDETKIYIVTNFHVIENATQVTISLDDEITAPANLVGSNEEADIAVISVLKTALATAGIKNYHVAEFAGSSKVQVGDAAIAIGNALGEGKSATLGIISAIGKTILVGNTKLEVFQTDAAINGGNSGGALVNANGQVVGVNTAKLSATGVEGMGYAIPSDVVSTIVNQIMNGTSVQKPYLGIAGATITDQYQRVYGFITKGVYVNSVEANSTAAAAGLRQGDIITSVNGQAITSYDQLTDIEAKTAIGATLTIKIVRNNREEMTLTTTMKAYIGRTNF